LEAGKAVIAEGYADAITAHQAGVTTVGATSGTTLTPQHFDTLGREANVLLVARDLAIWGGQNGVVVVKFERHRHRPAAWRRSSEFAYTCFLGAAARRRHQTTFGPLSRT